MEAMHKSRANLRLNRSQTVVVFDGLANKPGVTQKIRERYASKIRRVRLSAPADVDVLVEEDWLHKANSLRCAMRRSVQTPFVFVMEDDTVVQGAVDTSALHSLLTRDKTVEYVRLNMMEDCYRTAPSASCLKVGCVPPSFSEGRLTLRRSERGCPGICFSSELHTPCTPHSISPLLHRTHRWSDRPHIATRKHYEERLFASLPHYARVTPEQVLDQRARRHQDWPLWMYGRRGDMLRDYHWPQRIDGRLVGKENLPKGANMSMPYSHAYLIHAYKGPGKWDVSEQQIGAQKFRSHNPMWMLAVDGVREGDR